jgi:hypothetical protein
MNLGKGMRMQGEADRQAALAHRNSSSQDVACGVAGGTTVGWECIGGGHTIDPFNFSGERVRVALNSRLSTLDRANSRDMLK